MSNALAVTDSTFSTEVLGSSLPVVVDFWAEWCAPCRQLAPILDELAAQYEGEVKFVKVDTDSQTKIAADRDIRTLPTIQVFVDGDMVNEIVGAVTKMKLRQAVENVA